MLSGAKLPSIQENTAETGVGTVIETAPAPVFCVLAIPENMHYNALCTERQGVPSLYEWIWM